MQTVEFKERIDGIPCRVVANISYYPGFEPKEISLTILDRKGNPAPWLEAKLTHRAMDKLEETALQIDADNRSYYA